jgi:hypothetical protein
VSGGACTQCIGLPGGCMLLTIICCCTHAMADNPRGRFKARRGYEDTLFKFPQMLHARGTSGARCTVLINIMCCSQQLLFPNVIVRGDTPGHGRRWSRRPQAHTRPAPTSEKMRTTRPPWPVSL